MSKAEPWGQTTERLPTVTRPSGPGRPLLVVLAVALGVLVLASTGVSYYSSSYDGRVYPGATALGVDLSGKTREQARQALLDRASQYLSSPLTLRQGARTWSVEPGDLGLELDVEHMVQLAYSHGRAGSSWQQWRERAPLVHTDTTVRPRYVLDRSRIKAYITTVARDIKRKPVDSKLSLRADGVFLATQQVPGAELDVASASDQLYSIVSHLRKDELLLPVRSVEPARTRDEWRDPGSLQAVGAARPAFLTLGERRWTLTPDQLAGTVVAEAGRGPVVGRFDQQALELLLDRVGADVQRQPVDAALGVSDARAVVAQERPGKKLDTRPTLKALLAALSGSRSAAVVTEPVPANLTVADLAPAKRKLDTLLSADLSITYAKQRWVVPRATIASWVRIKEDRRAHSAQVAVSAADVRRYVLHLAPEVYQPPVDASLSVERGKVLLSKERPGRRVAVEATVRGLVSALNGNHSGVLAMQTVPVRLTAADLSGAKARLDTLLASPITLRFEDKTWTAPQSTLGAWAVVKPDPDHRTATV
ncbi:MAG: peptidoglycan binding domain-containing protein, partial [Chloroflexota bacterium]|nr:peptidoglycan binding domain-containing protein [Chloroflexota bacterium]